MMAWFWGGFRSIPTTGNQPSETNLYRARPVFGAGCEPGVTGSGSPNGNNGGIGCPKDCVPVAVCDENRVVFRHQDRWDKWKFCNFVPENSNFGTKMADFTTLVKWMAHFGFWDEKWVYFCIRNRTKNIFGYENKRKTDPNV